MKLVLDVCFFIYWRIGYDFFKGEVWIVINCLGKFLCGFCIGYVVFFSFGVVFYKDG